MRKQYLLGLTGLVLVLILVLAGCGGSDKTEPTSTPEPTNTPRPTMTPVPTVDVASLTVDDYQATKTALETELKALEDQAAGASASEEGSLDYEMGVVKNEIAEIQEKIDAAQGEGAGEDTADNADSDTADDDTAMMSPVSLTLNGAFDDAREWSWDELAELDMITATVAGPREDDPEAEYTGVSLSALLSAAGVGEDAEMLIATASDEFAAEIDLLAAKDCADCMVVLTDEGVLRLIMPDFPSNNWVRDVVSLEAQ